MTALPVALTIAGSDCSGGAGIQADLKTFTVLGVYGASVITAITAQNTVGVRSVQILSPEMVGLQMESVLGDLRVGALKTGMLGTEEIVREVSERVQIHGLERLVVDPVMRSKSGHFLLQPNAVKSLIDELFPLATVVTPNIPEAESLAGCRIDDVAGMKKAARTIKSFGPQWVVVKGGHLQDEAIDIVTDGAGFWELSSPRIETVHTHGTGCTFSAAITAFLAKGISVQDAIDRAKKFISFVIGEAVPIGQGQSPPNHLSYLFREREDRDVR